MIEKSKQKYVKPHMEVYELKHRARLLVGSSGDIPNSDPYEHDTDPFQF